MRRCIGVRSYAVVTHQGRTLRRNRGHLRKENIQDVKETRFEENSEMDIDPMEPLSTEDIQDTEEVIRQSTGPQPILQSQEESLGSHTNVRQREHQDLME